MCYGVNMDAIDHAVCFAALDLSLSVIGNIAHLGQIIDSYYSTLDLDLPDGADTLLILCDLAHVVGWKQTV